MGFRCTWLANSPSKKDIKNYGNELIEVPLIFICSFLCSGQNDVIDSNGSNSDVPDLENSKTAVVYFSATSNTMRVASCISTYLSVPLVEIVPKEKYTGDDINYNDSNSRTSRENADSSIRPEIENAIDADGYDTIILCYPIWFGKAPKILWTFAENTSFDNKTIIPVCTSASSGAGSSAVDLHNLTGKGTWIDAKRFQSSVSDNSVIEYIDSLRLKK